MELRVLGTVEAVVHGQPIDIGQRMERRLLGLLAIYLGRTVDTDRLIGLLWDTEPPARPRSAVQVHVSRIRKRLAAAGAERHGFALSRSGDGYLLTGEPDRVDLHRFRLLVERAAKTTDLAERVGLHRAAHALDRGGLFGEILNDRIWERIWPGIDAAFQDAADLRLAAELEYGRHHEVLTELAELVVRYPLRERLAELQILALYRAGRRAEALDAHQRISRRLQAELGLAPGEDLNRLHLAVLRDDPVLLLEPAEPAPAPAPAAEARDVPRLLPASIADFTGRADQLAALDALLTSDGDAPAGAAPGGASPAGAGSGGAGPVGVIAGIGGVGKTALGLRWAHQVRDRFPDGQLYVNLHGYSTSAPLRPIEALARFLRALGVPPGQIPVDLVEAVDLYRSRIAGRQLLVFLDNANSAEQVRPLLPVGAAGLALITSRDRLSGLSAHEGARRLHLDVLSGPDSVALLAWIVGPGRVAAESEAAAELAGLCDHLPLALRISAAYLADRPGLAIADHAAELRAGNRLAALEVDGDEQSSVRAAFDLSYQSLAPRAARLFRLLGLAPGPDLTATAAAQLAGTDLAEASEGLERLTAAHLVEVPTPGRWTMHDLVRAYARERSEADEEPADRAAAEQRLHLWYGDAAHTAAHVLHPQMLRLPRPSGPVTGAAAFDTHAQALAWLDAERVNLVAAIASPPAGLPSVAWLLADSLRGYFWLRKLTVDWFAAAEASLAAATAAGEPRARTAAHLSLSLANATLSRHDRALEHGRTALVLSRAHGFTDYEVVLLANRGRILSEMGRIEEGARTLESALRFDLTPQVRASILANLGLALLEQGQLHRAAAELSTALSLLPADELDNVRASLLSNLARSYHQLGRPALAVATFGRALALARGIASVDTVVSALSGRAQAHAELGHLDPALADLLEGTALVREHRIVPLEADVETNLADVRWRLGQFDEAVAGHTRAVAVAVGNAQPGQRTVALIRRAAASGALGRTGEALEDATAALALARELRYAVLEAQALTERARIHLVRGESDLAVVDGHEALRIHRTTGHLLGEARTLEVLAEATGDGGQWRSARDILAEIGVPVTEGDSPLQVP
ncbi:SARP family transcriptional regulator [Longispora fulva]|uniref:DNA-binding SARP family transcriptional activator n=1 Tax=Longispora fulva TaxID=619741 RepID=A0A8J7GH52_9ACTN|nr:BTAD domain-containing putative transcriptional regulator [Longispora fulva]MBG6137876.1 DNA-binding SARP family transcriptional activator [Longispora fulva]GIG60130.1 SARP family transcriptional regulator [Longispora fulva]